MYKLFYYIHLQFGIYSIKWYNNLYSYSKEDNYEKLNKLLILLFLISTLIFQISCSNINKYNEVFNSYIENGF